MRRSGPAWVYVGGVQQASEHFVERTTPQNIILDYIRTHVRSHTCAFSPAARRSRLLGRGHGLLAGGSKGEEWLLLNTAVIGAITRG